MDNRRSVSFCLPQCHATILRLQEKLADPSDIYIYTYSQTANILKVTVMPQRSCLLVAMTTAAASDAANASSRSATVVLTCAAEAALVVVVVSTTTTCDSSSIVIVVAVAVRSILFL